MLRTLRPPALAAALWLAAAGTASAQPAAAPSGLPDWIAALWQPVATWTAAAVGWVGAEEHIAIDDLHRFARRIAEEPEALEALVGEAGFSVNTISVGLSPLPDITLDLDFERRLTAQERADLIARTAMEGGAFGLLERSLLDLLLAAADSEHAVERDSGYALTGVEIDVDLIPRATMILSPRAPDRTAALQR
ncbi:hypothetical protein [Azospirillum halopraeferens]|uniref:hypothetical protein n=1 Tax=Azospirillum halopraeferens TaxID=34010 RepID=UPI0003F7A5E5|nr:hypothetical protein [Azospirillum halopraeferens]